MTCALCGYQAAYDVPTCPRCGALASAEAAPVGTPVGSSGPAATAGHAAGSLNWPAEVCRPLA